MTGNGLLQIVFYFGILILLAIPLGIYMARVYSGKSSGLDFLLRPLENFIYKICGIKKDQEMTWQTYAITLLLFSLFGIFLVYFLQRLQYFLPLNPQGFPGVKSDTAFNTAASFVTNTNWQSYIPEKSLSYLTQMMGLTTQNFLSAATGMSVLVAFIRGIVRRDATAIGNFWVDLVKSTLYVLLPLAIILALLLVSQGVIQNFHSYQKINVLQNSTYIDKVHNQTINITEQVLPMGPAASQIAIKQLGTNGGGFFAANSAHPFENPTPFTNLLEMLALLLIPAAFCFTFGNLVKDKRQGWAVFLAMTLIFIPFLLLGLHAEQSGNPLFSSLHIDQKNHSDQLHNLSAGGNMEGKETRFGIVNSALWTTATSAASNGAVNSMLDSYTPLGGLVPMWLMQLGEVVYGGVGSGLYGMLIFIILTVFIAGLMVGRTPEYLGKKIEVFEIKMASLVILVPHFLILLSTAIVISTQLGRNAIYNPGAHGFSEVLYNITSVANNNGSAFSGLNADTPFYNILFGLIMLLARFWVIVPVLAIAGSLVKKKTLPITLGTMPTHTPLFICLVICIVLIFGALTFFPALALGPIVEHLLIAGH